MVTEKMEVGLLGAFAGLLATLARMDWFMFFLFLIILFMDFVTGNISAIRKKKWNSSIFKDKLLGKTQEVIAVFALMVTVVAVHETGIQVPLLGENIKYVDKMLIGAFLFKDMYSILENTDHVPVIVKKWLEKLREQDPLS